MQTLRSPNSSMLDKCPSEPARSGALAPRKLFKLRRTGRTLSIPNYRVVKVLDLKLGRPRKALLSPAHSVISILRAK
jgi:hypothetical protein